MKHNSVYHLHVPRTSGIFIRNHIANYFENPKHVSHNAPLYEKDIKFYSLISGHYGQYPIAFMNNPLIFSIMRNPVERYISYYKYVRHKFPEYKNNDLLDYWINDTRISELHSNTHLKCFTGSINIEKYNKYFVSKYTSEENWFLENYSNDVNDGINFIKHNYIFTMEDINKMTLSITNLLNIPNFTNLYKYNSSDKSDWGITKKQYAKIEELNQKDMELYEYARNKEKEYSILYS